MSIITSIATLNNEQAVYEKKYPVDLLFLITIFDNDKYSYKKEQ